MKCVLIYIYPPYFENMREVVIWSGQWPVVFSCDGQLSQKIKFWLACLLVYFYLFFKLVQVSALDIEAR